MVKKIITMVMFTLLMTIQQVNAVEDGAVFKDWTGTCQTSQSGESFCGVAQIVKGDDGKPMARLLMRKVQEDTLALYIKVPLGVNIIANVRVSLDNEPLAVVPYNFCDPEGCNAVMPVEPKLEEAIKAGSSLTIGFFRVNEEFSFNASLSGVTAAINSL